jgi:hypothetical protein
MRFLALAAAMTAGALATNCKAAALENVRPEPARAISAEPLYLRLPPLKP